MRKIKTIKHSLYFMICLVMIMVAMPFAQLTSSQAMLLSTSVSAFKPVQELEFSSNATNVEEMSTDLFNNQAINSMEYLYNFDDSADYIYVEFTDGGYVVYLRDNLSVLEYSPVGNLPFSDIDEVKYYNGPKNYYEKVQDKFIDKLTGKEKAISILEAKKSFRQN